MATSFQSALFRAKKKRKAAVAPALPPLGSFDPQILLQYGQNQRTGENAQSQYDLGQAQAQDNFGIQTGRSNASEQNALADILTNRNRTTEDYGLATANLGRNYASLARKQAEGARQLNVESGGILAQALAKRQANQALDQSGLDRTRDRALADSTTAEGRTKQAGIDQRADLALNLSRLYGSGTGGAPLGANTLNLTQTLNDALSGNLDLSGVAYGQAAANGFRFPRKKKKRQEIF